MKTWEVKIKASDEKTALEYLQMLITGFKASVTINQDMDSYVIEDPKKKESLICRLTKTK